MIPPNESYIYVIVALLPVVATMVMFQTNPYHALALRGILGAIAAMTYAILGAADVALTEALVGTLLAITLYAIAVRSSLVLRLGVLESEWKPDHPNPQWEPLLKELRAIFKKRHMRVELQPYPNLQALHRALTDREVHATCVSPLAVGTLEQSKGVGLPYRMGIRLKHLYDLIKADLTPSAATLTHLPQDSLPDTSLANTNLSDAGLFDENPFGAQLNNGEEA